MVDASAGCKALVVIGLSADPQIAEPELVETIRFWVPYFVTIPYSHLRSESVVYFS